MTLSVSKPGMPHPITETPGVRPVKTKDPVMGKLPGFADLADEPRLMNHLAQTNPTRWGNLPFTTLRQAAGAALQPFRTAGKNLGRFLIAGGATAACFAGAAWMTSRLVDVQLMRAAEKAAQELNPPAEVTPPVEAPETTGSITRISKEEAIVLLEAQLVTVPGGTFMMGSETGDEDERPAHSVTILDGWQVAKYEMSQKIYAGLTGTNPAKKYGAYSFVGDDLPAVGMGPQDAASACQAAGMELPSEELWEYIARHGNSQFEYPTDDGTNKPEFINTGGKLKPVTWGLPGPFGVFNLGGNALEWTSSNYTSYVSGILWLGEYDFVLRGGGYDSNNQIYTRAAKRFVSSASSPRFGLRCVRPGLYQDTTLYF